MVLRRNYQLNRLLIEKEAPDRFRIITSGGSIVRLNRTALLLLLAVSSSQQKELMSELRSLRVFLSESEVHRSIDLFLKLSLLQTRGEKFFNVEVLKENVKAFYRGACSLSDIAIAVTNQCGFSCPYCYRSSHERSPNTLSTAMFKSILRDAISLGAIAVGFTGGEPSTVWQKVSSLAIYAKELGFLVITVLTRNVFLSERIIQEWAEHGVTHIKLSLDPSWDEKLIITFVERFRRQGVNVSLGYTFFSDAVEPIRWAAALGKKVGIKVRFSPYIPLGRLPPLIPRDITKIWHEIHLIQERGTGLAEGIGIYEKVGKGHPMICDAGISYAYVEHDGHVGGCPLLTSYFPVGQVTDEKFFLEIWKQGDWSFYRKVEPINPKCAFCSLRSSCIGGCKAMALARFGTPKMVKSPIQCTYREDV